ncbi:uncharacterized protein LOC141667299 isoform X4 [Apium graveolens]|uniref:uncharacterized protein LOC141667299 isoform X4 n=1 Tax=Apium graveolens TaxID=4045 RepID=UPI003D796BE3
MACLLHAPSMLCSRKHFHYRCGVFGVKYLSSKLVVQSISMEYKSSYKQGGRQKYDCLLFDLDDTLYPVTSGLAAACSNNVEDFMVYKLGIDRNITSELGDLLYKNYGTTMAGLKIFTNADKVHAVTVLICLGLKDCFEEIICFETLNPIKSGTVCVGGDTITGSSKLFDIISHFCQPNTSASILPKTPIVCKPCQHAIEKALKIGNIDPQRTLIFEDSVRTIQSAKLVGLDTALVGTSERIQGADYVLQSIHNIRDAIPELWVPVNEL